MGTAKSRINKKMKIYLISDTHFGHGKMLEYCNRPPDFEALLYAEIYELPADSMLIHLGDFCIGNDKNFHEYFAEAKCRKILVRGNHDYKSNNWYLTHGWDFICNNFQWNVHNKIIRFSHRPMKIKEHEWNIHGHFHNALPRLLESGEGFKEERDKPDLEVLTNRHILISSEELNYKPVLLDTVINNASKK